MMRITPSLGPAVRKMRPNQARIRVPNSTITLNEAEMCALLGHSSGASPRACGGPAIKTEGFLFLAKGAVPRV